MNGDGLQEPFDARVDHNSINPHSAPRPRQGDMVIRPMTVPHLTSLRFFAALQVLVFHVGRMSPEWTRIPNTIQAFFLNGYEAVSFFFVLSGFVLGMSTARQAENGWSKSEIQRFWWARLARIYPAYALSLLVALPVFLYGAVYVGQLTTPETVKSLVLVPLFLQAWVPRYALAWNIPAWSLSVEVLLYALFPMVSRFLARRGPAMAATLALLLVGCVSELRPAAFESGVLARDNIVSVNFTKYFPLLFVPHFLLGAALSRVRVEWKAPASSFYASVGLLLALFASRDDVPAWMLRDVLLVPLYGLLILCTVNASGSPSTKWLAWPPLVLLGESSYALYILHWPFASWWQKIERTAGHGVMTSLGELALFVVICIASSCAVFNWIETPLRQWILQNSPILRRN